jgi:hypothetical protein
VASFDPVAPAITAASVPASGFSGVPLSMAAAATDRMSAPGLRFDFGDGSSAAGGRRGAHLRPARGLHGHGHRHRRRGQRVHRHPRPIHVAQGPVIGGGGPNRVLAATTASWDRLRNGRTRMKTLAVNELAGPVVVKLVCKGKAARGVNKTIRMHGKKVSFTKQVKGMTLRPKATADGHRHARRAFVLATCDLVHDGRQARPEEGDALPGGRREARLCHLLTVLLTRSRRTAQ